MYRIEFTRNNPSKKPKAVTLGILDGTYKSLIKFTAAKFKYNKKKIRLFVCRNSHNTAPGYEITDKSDVNNVLNNGIVITVSDGKN